MLFRSPLIAEAGGPDGFLALSYQGWNYTPIIRSEANLNEADAANSIRFEAVRNLASEKCIALQRDHP